MAARPIAVATRARASLDMETSGWRSAMTGSAVEVGVQDPDLGDAVDGELVGLGGPADGLGAGAVVDAEGGLFVGGHIGVDPGDPLGGVAVDHDLAGLGPALVDGDGQPLGEAAFDQV